MRGADSPHLFSKVFPSTFSCGRGIQFHAFSFYSIGSSGLGIEKTNLFVLQMKQKFLLLGLLAVSGALSVAAQGVFNKGDRKADLTIGVGTVAYPDNSGVTFDQHLGMEWGIASFADKFTLGIGFTVNNSYGGSIESMVAGTYDYTYVRRSYGKTYSYKTNKWESFNDTKEIRRNGVGTADADVAREDVNALFTAAIHFSPMAKLDTYLKVGAGVGYMSWLVSNLRNESGFKSANVHDTSSSKVHQTTDSYSYDDLDHVKWQGFKSKVVPAMSFYLGATYMLTEKWGVDAQIGLISANIKGSKKGYPNSYGIFALGASYRF